MVDLLYADETNLEERDGDFFAYGGVLVPGDAAGPLHARIDELRREHGVERASKLKFKPCPREIDEPAFRALKQAILSTAADHGVVLVAALVLHDIARAKGVDQARLWCMNQVAYHYDCLLRRRDRHGLVVIDRFTDGKIDAHTREKIAVGLKWLPSASETPLERIVGFHYGAIGQSHFCSLVDIAMRALREVVNCCTRGDGEPTGTSRAISAALKPLMFSPYGDDRVDELSITLLPKTIRAPVYIENHRKLKEFLEQNGLVLAQRIRESAA